MTARPGGRRWRGALAALVAAAAVTVGVAAPAAAAPAPSSGCADVETIAVRGSTERQGGGSIAGPLADALQDDLPQTVQTHDLVYPASLSNYSSSVRQGVSALQERLEETSERCADIRFVLIGYSQGAQVVGDALQAGPPAADRIGAAVFFGDPTFNGSEPYDLGSYSERRDGVFPRAEGALDAFSDVIASYCNATDNFCQRGANGNGHYTYRSDRQAAVEFVDAELGGPASTRS